MTSLLAYCDPWSVAPGESVDVMVSCEGADRFRADLVRVTHPAAGYEAPLKEEIVPVPANGEYPARRQALHAGSWAFVPASPLIAAIRNLTLQCFLYPTLPHGGPQAIMGSWSESEGRGFLLGIDAEGCLELRLGDGRGGVSRASTGQPLTANRWYLVAATFDSASRGIVLYQQPLDDHVFSTEDVVHLAGEATLMPTPGPGPFMFAGWHESGDKPDRMTTGGHFNGRIDRPRLSNRALGRDELIALAGPTVPEDLGGAVVAAWDFSHDISGESIRDIHRHGLHGRTVNQPTRAIPGHNWTGAEMNWSRVPEQYGAIHFHDDDLDDARWQPDLKIELPEDLKSGTYAVRLKAGETHFRVPFFVRPPRGRATARVAYLAATASYIVYGNLRSRMTAAGYEVDKGRLTVMDATDVELIDRRQLGLSCYDVHRDGSPVYYASRLRPLTNMRPTGRLINYAADLFVVDWLEASGEPYDVIADEDLEAEGMDLLAPYRVVVTGSHPEYYSLGMLDAVEGWLRRGGRFMYMGGNGFYWRAAWHPEKPGRLEVRRAEDGTRANEAEVGAYYHSFTGEYGGLWRRNHRAPNKLVGNGFISQGFDASVPFRRRDASRDPRVAFMFEGIEDENLGDFGILEGGAAGQEIDCYDQALGSPPHGLVVASSEGHSNIYMIANEDMGSLNPAVDGVHHPKIRADMVFFETDGGGAVFSVGSIAYSGSLGHRGGDNDIARLTTNVLRRFVDETPFPPPRPAHAPPGFTAREQKGKS